MLENSEKAELTRRCPVCGKKSVYVFESRSVQPGICNESHRRRRLVCKSCGARFTSREISDELFQMLMKHSELLRKASFGFKQTFLEDKTSCRSCIHFVKTDKRHRCGLGLPEFMTQDAQDCNNYHRVNHQ